MIADHKVLFKAVDPSGFPNLLRIALFVIPPVHARAVWSADRRDVWELIGSRAESAGEVTRGIWIPTWGGRSSPYRERWRKIDKDNPRD